MLVIIVVANKPDEIILFTWAIANNFVHEFKSHDPSITWPVFMAQEQFLYI